MRLAGQCARASRAIGIALACQRCPSASETCGFSRAPTTLAARSTVIAVAAVGPLCTLQALLHQLRLIRPQRHHNRVDHSTSCWHRSVEPPTTGRGAQPGRRRGTWSLLCAWPIQARRAHCDAQREAAQVVAERNKQRAAQDRNGLTAVDIGNETSSKPWTSQPAPNVKG